MLKQVLFLVAVAEALTLAACHHAATEESSQHTGTTPASSVKSAQPPQPAAKSEPAKAATSAASSTATAGVEAPESDAWLLVEDDALTIPVIDKLGRDLLAADSAVKTGKPQQAARNLRDGAAYLLTLHPTEAKANGAIASATKELNAVAKDLDGGHVDTKRLARAYRQAFDADVNGYWATLEFAAWQPYSNRPAQHLDRALTEFKTDPHAAATDIRKANSYLQMEDTRHPNDLLASTVQELDDLADRVSQGKVKEASQIEDAIADSGHALAATHYQVAVNAWKRHDQALASRELEQSVRHLKRAARRADAKTLTAIMALNRDAEVLVKDVQGDVAAFTRRVEAELKQVKAELALRRSKPATVTAATEPLVASPRTTP